MRLFAGNLLNNKNRDFSLDLLRAISCIMVVGVHVQQRLGMPGALGRFFEKGATGVGFFFILSGYLAYMSMSRLFSGTGITFKGILKFWIKRALHVLPLYYMVMLFYFLFYLAIGGIPKDETGLYWLRYIFLINLWVPANDVFWTNLGAVWSISAFMLFYLIAPFLFLVVRKYYTAWLGVVLCYGVFKITDFVGTGRLPVRYMFYFLLGILVYLAIKEGKELGLAAILSFVILFCFLVDSGTAIITPFLAVLYIMAGRNGSGKNVNGVLAGGVGFVSTISYSIYLVHVAVLSVMDCVTIESVVIYLPVFVLLTLVLSYLSYNLIEARFARWAEAKLFDLLGI